MKPKKNQINFTEARLRDLPKPEKRSFYIDKKQPGLRLSVTPAGTKTFQCRAWSKEHQKPVTKTLGRWPAMNVEQARDHARKTISQIADGQDIETQRQQKRMEMTCSEMFQLWYDEYGKALRSGSEVKATLARYAEKPLGSRKISSVSSPQIQTWYNALLRTKKRDGNTLSAGTANNALRSLKEVFNKFLPPGQPTHVMI